jgi:transposase-like protein
MSKPSKHPELAQTDLIERLPAACANEAAAVEFLETERWGDAPYCGHCGTVGECYKMTDRKTGKRNQRFLWKCRACSKMFTVRTGTVYAESLIPLHKWCRALWECASAKNGCSALELSRRIQVSYKTALFLMHRIRCGMEPGGPQPKLTGTIEADEMYWGGRARHSRVVRGSIRRGPNPDKPKTPIFAVVERGGEVRARVMPSVNSGNVREALLNMADPSCRLITDELKAYRRIGKPFAKHDRVNHKRKEYVSKTDPTCYTNTIESFFARVRRQLSGTYHNVSKEHLHRYVAHAEFLYNTRGMNDGERAKALMRAVEGKRLMYRDPAKRRTA